LGCGHHGEAGIAKYSYTITVNGAVVAQGEDSITSEFEDTDF
jgi:hypothetical protein